MIKHEKLPDNIIHLMIIMAGLKPLHYYCMNIDCEIIYLKIYSLCVRGGILSDLINQNEHHWGKFDICYLFQINYLSALNLDLISQTIDRGGFTSTLRSQFV